MRLSWLLSLPAVLTVASAIAIEKRDADFLSVRTKMHKDMSGRRGDPKEKYFRKLFLPAHFHPHYDGRFADHQLGYRERKQALSNLIQTYLATMADVGVETWLMHGTLLGWWWNRKILPWDSDSDVQVSESSMHYLASYYNMTVFHYKTPRIPEGRDYMMEINPHYENREQTDKLNVIDARWVDTSSGLFIDITTARYNWTHPAGDGMLSCKDGHEYRDSYIFPLRETFFEGTPAKIPFAYKEILEAEYKQKALTQVDFEGHHFDEDKLEWIPVPKKLTPTEIRKAEEEKKHQDDKKVEEQKKQIEQQKKQAQAAKVTKPDAKQAPLPPKAADASEPDGPQVVKQPKHEQPPAQKEADTKHFDKEEKRQDSKLEGEEKRKVQEAAAAKKDTKP
ncbi:Protein MNN4 [Lachnellula suecica]|uniref:Protein MNN4 n=1 Tax=Lachnellula suecica TaxID=602035 RepID=A0A8T9CF46_9HELO|nr:Protein MNN4 [Lachnellula suecica]